MDRITVRRVASRTLATFMVVSLVLFPLGQLANAASDLTSQTGASSAIAPTSSNAMFAAVPSVLLDATFTPLPRGGRSPWDGEFQIDGIDGLSYNSPGTEVKVRAMSSNAFFVDEVWLVYPRVQYLFNNKDVPDLGNQFDAIQFSDWITVGTFPPGTELVFGVKTGVGIDNTCTDRTNPDGSIDRHHCYKVTQDPTWVPLAPDPLRVCAIADDACRNKAWPSQTPDGRTIFYTGPGLRNVKDNSPHGRFQYLTNTKRDGTGTPLTNTALFGLEDVGAPVQQGGAACPGAKDLAGLKTTTDVVVSTAAQTIGLTSVAGLAVGSKITITQPFQRETVTITAVNAVAKTITAVFATPDSKTYPAGTNWAPEGCDWHPDFQDAGIVVWPALAATCQSTDVKNKVVIVGQEGYGSVTLRDATQTTPFAQSFKPGDAIAFTVDQGLPVAVSGASPSWSVNLHGQALMSITDPSKAVDDPNRTIDAGICFDPTFPPLPVIKAITGTLACDAAWDFTISNVTTATAPPSIRVKWTNDQTPPADEAATIPLTSVGADGIAHYRSDLFTSLRVVEATTTSPTFTWAGTFALAKGPCPVVKTADVTQACPVSGATEWDITISGTTQAQAPASVHVTWDGGAQADVPLGGAVGADGTAHYRTTSNLATAIAAATASIQGAWTGLFKVNGGPCPGKKQLTLTVIPACTVGVTSWDITLSQLTATLAPASVSAIWSGQTTAEAVALTGTVGADGIAHYTTAAHTGATYRDPTSVSANIAFPSQADADAFTGTLTVPGVPCPPPPSPSPSPTPTPQPCITASPSPRPTPTRTPTPSPKPGSGTGTGGNGGTGGASSAGSSAGTNSKTNSGTASLSAGGTNSVGSNAGTNSGSESGTIDGDLASGGTNEGDNTCEGPKPSPSPSNSPRPSPSSSPTASPSTSPAAGTIHVKTSTLAGHECNSSEWHFVITQVTSLSAPITIHVYWANGQDAVLPLERVTGGTAHYRTTLNLSSAVTDAIAALSGSYGQFNVSHGPCLLSNSQTLSSATPKPSETPRPSATPKPSDDGGKSAKPSPTPKVEFVSNDSSGGVRTITLRVRIPGTGEYRTITVTLPKDR